MQQSILNEGVSKSFRAQSITKYTLTFDIARWEATQRVMATKLTRLTHKTAIQLHPVAESCTILSSHSRRPVRKLLDTPLYLVYCTKKILIRGSWWYHSWVHPILSSLLPIAVFQSYVRGVALKFLEWFYCKPPCMLTAYWEGWPSSTPLSSYTLSPTMLPLLEIFFLELLL
jgi:hypothetical protein